MKNKNNEDNLPGLVDSDGASLWQHLKRRLGPTKKCLPLDRIFVAMGLTEEEKEHFQSCEFCKSREEVFRD